MLVTVVEVARALESVKNSWIGQLALVNAIFSIVNLKYQHVNIAFPLSGVP